jgi:hypothetical protein
VKSVTIEAGEVRSRGPWGRVVLDVASVLPAASLALVAGALQRERGVSWMVLIAWTALILVLFGIPEFVAWRPSVRHGVVRADSDGVWLDGTLHVPRATMATGELLLAPDGKIAVRLASGLGRRAHLVVVRSKAEGRAVLDALGLGSTRSAVSFRADEREPASPFHSRAVLASMAACALYLLALAFAGRGSHMPGFLAANLIGQYAVGRIIVVALRKRVTVGSDGVLINRLLRQRRFFTHARIKELYVDDESLVLVADGETQRLRFRGSSVDVTEASREFRHDALARHVARLRKFGLRGGRSNVALTGDPASLEAAATGHSSYREPARARESVWGVVEDPAAPREARVRAAVALRVSEADAGRLRVAVEATADPDLHAELGAEAERAERGAEE